MALLIGRARKPTSQLFWRITGVVQQERSQTNLAHSVPKDVAGSQWDLARPFSEVPSPGWRLKFNFLPGGKYANLDFIKMFEAIRDDYGDIVYLPSMLGKPAILMTHNPDDHEIVFRNEGIWPERHGNETLEYHRNKYRADFFQGTEGLIATQGQKWGDFRTVVNPVMMQPKNVHRYFKKMADVNLELIQRIRDIRDPKTLEVPADFEEEINRWTLESVSVVALDKQLGLLSQNRNNPTATRLFEHMNTFFTLTYELDMGLSFWRFFPTPNFKKLMAGLDGVLDITATFVKEAVNRLESERKAGITKDEHDKSVLEKLLAIDPKIATVMAMDMLMAGVDTTSSTFTGLLLCMAKNPDKQEKLRQEIYGLLPEKDSDFDAAKWSNSPYLRACIKESLRLYPLTGGNMRTIKKDVVLSGYQVPKDTAIMMPSYTFMRNEKYFPRPNEFLPERWLRQTTEESSVAALKLTHPFVYLPFGFGPRMCIGRRIVEMELELGIARLLRNFHIEFNHPTENAFRTVLINVPNIPLQFKFTDLPN